MGCCASSDANGHSEKPLTELPKLKVDKEINRTTGRRGSLKTTNAIPVVNPLPDIDEHDNTEVPLVPAGNDQRRFSLQTAMLGRVSEAVHEFFEAIFAFYDKEGNETISRENVLVALQGFNNESASRVIQELKEIDYDGDGTIDKDEFMMYLSSLGNMCESLSDWKLLEAKTRKNLGMPESKGRKSMKKRGSRETVSSPQSPQKASLLNRDKSIGEVDESEMEGGAGAEEKKAAQQREEPPKVAMSDMQQLEERGELPGQLERQNEEEDDAL